MPLIKLLMFGEFISKTYWNGKSISTLLLLMCLEASASLSEQENFLIHWGRVTHICVSKIIIIGSHNGLSPGRRQAVIWTNDGISLIGPLQTSFSEIWIQINTFSFTKLHLKMSSGKYRPYCLGLNVLIEMLWKLCESHSYICTIHIAIIWGNACISTHNPLVLLQTMISRIITWFKQLSHTHPLNELGLLRLNDF